MLGNALAVRVATPSPSPPTPPEEPRQCSQEDEVGRAEQIVTNTFSKKVFCPTLHRETLTGNMHHVTVIGRAAGGLLVQAALISGSGDVDSSSGSPVATLVRAVLQHAALLVHAVLAKL